MIRKAANGALRLAKGAAVFWGAVVTLAVVLGAGTQALAAVPGDPFKLGEVNVLRGTTSLVADAGGPTLKVENNQSSRAATALDLRMANPNLAPMRTNATGTVGNLSADSLDGKDSAEFLGVDGTARSAADADKLDGKDAAQIGINGYTGLRVESAFDSSARKTVTADCPAGTKLLGGGATALASGFDPNHADAPIALRSNSPDLNGVGYWSATAIETEPYGFEWRLHVRVICAKVGNQ